MILFAKVRQTAIHERPGCFAEQRVAGQADVSEDVVSRLAQWWMSARGPGSAQQADDAPEGLFCERSRRSLYQGKSRL